MSTHPVPTTPATRETRDTRQSARRRRSTDNSAAPRLRPIDLVASLLIVSISTDTYKPIGLLLKVPTSQILTIAIALLVFVYCVIRIEDVRVLSRTLLFRLWTVAMFFPVLIMLIQAILGILGMDRLVYWSAFICPFYLASIAFAILCLRYSERFVELFFTVAIATTAISFAVNLIDYSFIRQVLLYTSNPIGASLEYARIFGFYQHPNAAALAVSIYLLVLVTQTRLIRRPFIYQALLIALVVSMILVTGSRTSLILLIVIVLVYAIAGAVVWGPARALVRLLIAPAAVIPLVLFAGNAALGGDTANNSIATVVSQRLASFVNLLTGTSDASDQSVSLRLGIVRHYSADIQQSPVIGRGPDFATVQITAGNYSTVSQNSWLEWSLNFGILAAVLCAVYLVGALATGTTFYRRNTQFTLFLTTMIAITVIATFSLIDLFWLYPVCILQGLALGRLSRLSHIHGHPRDRSTPAEAIS